MRDRFCPHCMQALSGEDAFCPVCGRDVDQRAAPHQLPIGTVLRSQKGHTFLFGEVKGDGGFGLTYIAKELTSGKVVAIKEYFPTRCQPQRRPDHSVCPTTQMEEIYRQGMHSFLSEASMLRAVAGTPSIVHVLDFFEANGTAYMVMDYLNGTTLRDLLQSQSRFEPNLLLKKVLPLMRDLGAIHEAGVLHRDIAPDNIMLMPDGTLTLLDFGCARSMEDGKSMTVVLKPGFAPIEQYQTRGQGPYTDVYALCATLYYCLTGKVPPAAPERLSATFDGQNDPLLPPSALGAALSREQEELLLWGLALQPTVRPQNMEELASRLEKTLVQSTWSGASQPLQENTDSPATEAVTPTPRQSLPDFLRKHGLKLLLGLAGVVIVILLLLLLL
ncbi:MAG: serine/threonine protein kinase [Oscillospiraceae bacterium]